MLYSAAFDVADTTLALGTITLTLQSGAHSPAVVTLANVLGTPGDGSGTTSIFYHWNNLASFGAISEDPTATLRRGDISKYSFGLSLAAALVTAATAQSWSSPSGITVVFDTATGLYTIAYPTAAFSITWSTAAGRELCGFAANEGNGTTHVGTVVPTYAIIPTLSAVSVDGSADALNFEPEGIASQSFADTGGNFGIEREVSPTFRDWIQQYETKAKTLRRSAASTHPWTYQALFEHCRCRFPFIVDQGFGASEAEIFTLRAEGSAWGNDTRKRASLANDTQFHVMFKTVVEGLLTGGI